MLRSEKKMKVQWLLSFVKVVPEINGIHSDSSSCAPRWGGFTGYKDDLIRINGL